MTPTQRAAAQQALEALDDLRGYRQDIDDAIGALVEALAEQPAEQVLVAYVCPTSHVTADGSMEDGPDYLAWADEASNYEKRVGTPLYTTPQPVKRVPLTREHVRAAGGVVHSDGNVFFTSLDQLNSTIEAAHDITGETP